LSPPQKAELARLIAFTHALYNCVGIQSDVLIRTEQIPEVKYLIGGVLPFQPLV
jgi:hypothetical protein